ncbi:MAG: pilus assembly protein [Phycisphaerales bacterium]|nr:MAG: pilus assembly protein [Phycisphaerales bacterium]
MVKTRRENKRRYRGTAVVEAAIVFPLLLILTLGAIEYGWLFLKAQLVTNAARQGARIGILEDATEAEVLAIIDGLMIAGGLPVYTPTLSDTTLPDGRAGILVQIQVPCSDILIVNAPSLFPTPEYLRATVTMAKEGV